MESVSGFICVLLKAVSTVAMPTVCCIPTDYFHLRFHPVMTCGEFLVFLVVKCCIPELESCIHSLPVVGKAFCCKSLHLMVVQSRVHVFPNTFQLQ